MSGLYVTQNVFSTTAENARSCCSTPDENTRTAPYAWQVPLAHTHYYSPRCFKAYLHIPAFPLKYESAVKRKR